MNKVYIYQFIICALLEQTRLLEMSDEDKSILLNIVMNSLLDSLKKEDADILLEQLILFFDNENDEKTKYLDETIKKMERQEAINIIQKSIKGEKI